MKSHIRFDKENWRLELLDQRLLPTRREYFFCYSFHDVIRAIKEMVVRGAPAIGVTAAYACVLAAKELEGNSDWTRLLPAYLTEIANARPTAVNLAWAVERMREKAFPAVNNMDDLLGIWLDEAALIQKEDLEICHEIGHHGACLIQDGQTVLTHCNAGALATAGYGTALGIIRAAAEEGKRVRVIADETRPLLQGARLTAFELMEDGIEVMLACDNACALLLSKGYAQLVITGADRVAANGDAANKIGTLGVAIIASRYNIPFYIACPLSTIDRNMPDGQRIPIEARPGREVTSFMNVRIAPENTRAYNFAFDVTPAELISAIITERGILRPPYEKSIAQAFDSQILNP